MIWLDYRNTSGWKTDQGPVTLNGMTWEVWRWDKDDQGAPLNYVAYLAKTHTTCVKDLDIKAFLDDSQKQGYIQPSWYLYAVEAGIELRNGGIPDAGPLDPDPYPGFNTGSDSATALTGESN
jgi:hypothetical protein